MAAIYQNNPGHPLFKTFYRKDIQGTMNNLGHVKGVTDRDDFSPVIEFQFE